MMVQIELEGQFFTCREGVMPQLDCPIFPKLIEQAQGHNPRGEPLATQAVTMTLIQWPKIPLGDGELAHLVALDPMLMHAWKATSGHPP